MKITKVLRLVRNAALALVVLVTLAAGGVYGLSQLELERPLEIALRPVAVPTGTAAVERGRHIAATRGCADCHGADFGGVAVINDPMVGRIDGPNLTPGRGGLPADYQDEDFVRALRHGIDREGRPLVLMPSAEYAVLSDEDLGALIAYLRTLPPVDRDRGPVAPGPIARLLMLTGEFKLAARYIDHGKVQPARVDAAVTKEYGHYLAASCIGCHGEAFAGGRIPASPPDWPAAANLTPHPLNAISGWTEHDFINVMRTSKRPDGSALSPVMPAAFGQMTDGELQALWLYLQALPPVAGDVR